MNADIEPAFELACKLRLFSRWPDSKSEPLLSNQYRLKDESLAQGSESSLNRLYREDVWNPLIRLMKLSALD